MAKVETIVALPCAPDRVPLATEIRSTTLVSSRNSLRTAGVFDAYLGYLPAVHASALESLVPGTWVPMAIGVAHYAAVDRLGLSPQQAKDNGRSVAQSVQNSHFAILIRTLGGGVTLWSAFPRLPSFLARQVQGGACAVYKRGPKDALVEIHGVPIARFAYVRHGWAGMLESTLELLAHKVYATDESPGGGQLIARFVITWA
jgi:hypothetical protein